MTTKRTVRTAVPQSATRARAITNRRGGCLSFNYPITKLLNYPILFLVLLGSAVWAQSPSPPSRPALDELKQCAQKRTPASCGVSKKELQEAHRDFRRGLKLQKAGKNDAALDAFESAAGLVTRDLEYATVREVLRQKIVYQHVQKGNSLVLAADEKGATAEFRQAVQLDPNNSFALQRLADAASHTVPPRSHQVLVADDSGELRLQPQAVRATFHLRGDTRSVYEDIGRAFGVTPRFDESLTSRQIRFDLEDADFATAMRVAGLMSKSSWSPLSSREFLVYADTVQNRGQYERMSLRSFYIPDAVVPQDLTDIVNTLRSIFEIRYITLQPSTLTLTVRAPRPILDAATVFLQSLDSSRPQVMLDFQVFQVSQTLMRAIGVSLPLQLQAFQLGAAALAALQNPATQDLVNQLIASGGINQANTTALSALLAQLQNQSTNPLLQTSFFTFGGGQTLTAVPFPKTTVNFSHNESHVVSLQHMTLRASQGSPATMLIGERYPVLNSTFSPIFNTPAIAQVIQNNSFVAPFPSFNYEDLGLIVKATPQIHPNDVRLELNVEVRALSAQSLNGVPVINNRQYTGWITVRDGEAAVVAGMLDQEDVNTLTGLPGISRVPVLGYLTSTRNKQATQTEFLLVITPHLVRTREPAPPAITIPSS